jgi:hypothetical protein
MYPAANKSKTKNKKQKTTIIPQRPAWCKSGEDIFVQNLHDSTPQRQGPEFADNPFVKAQGGPTAHILLEDVQNNPVLVVQKPIEPQRQGALFAAEPSTTEQIGAL